MAGAKAEFDDPIFLELGEGMGIRDFTRLDDKNYIIIAGGFGEEKKPFKLFRWAGESAAKPQEIPINNQLDGLNAEAVIVYPPATNGAKSRIQILSNDEDKPNCKNNQTFGFRSVFVDF